MPWPWIPYLPRSHNELTTHPHYCTCRAISAVAERIQAGTSCGSCRCEIRHSLAQQQTLKQTLKQTLNQTLNLKCTTSPSRST
jgi:NAD(P)H-nitrite reductase large subunit